jgi:uncharacterized membrane protein
MVTVLVATPVLSYGQTVTAMWDPNPASQLVQTYDVCVGTTSMSCNFTNASVTAPSTSYTFLPNAGVLYRVAVRAVSAAGAGAYSPEVLVSVPALSALANRTSTVNTAISPVTISATDPDGSPLSYTHTGLPFGLTLNQSTGVISGTPTSTGTYNVTIFVTDGLATAAAAFVWTIQTQSTDTVPPTLSITSHTNGQTVTTSSITLSGTATDSGTGNSGIQSVTVNGAAATGGTATGSNTANWSRSVSLATGANTLTVVATDGVGNVRTSTITITRATADTAPPTLTITSHTNGQTVTTGNITLSGTATDSGTGGSGITGVTVNGTATGATATGNGTANWSRALTLTPGANTITVVATDGAGNNRSVTITVTYNAPAVVSAVSIGPSSGSGAAQTFALQYTDTRGATDLSTAWVWFNATFASTSTNSCMLQYNRAASAVWLLNDGQTWMSGTLGSGATLQNSQCAVSLAGSSATLSGTTLTLNLAMTFKPGYAGTKNVYMYAANGSNVNSGWQTRGTWTVPGSTAAAVTADSATPNAGSGATQTFSLQYSDTVGATDLLTTWVWFNATFASTSTSTCLAQYNRASNTLLLLNDASTIWMPGTLGSTSTLQNSQCAINLAGSSVTLSGTTLTLNLATTFKSAYAGAKNIYMYAANGFNVNSGWQTRGTWTVPGAGVATVTADSATPNAGSGATQLFALNYSDTLGASDLATTWVWFNATFAATSTNSCLLFYNQTTSMLYMLNDGQTWMTGRLGGEGYLQNSQCAVNLPSSFASISGNTLTLNLAMTFKPAYAGAKNIYMYGANGANVNSGWQTRGTWTAP